MSPKRRVTDYRFLDSAASHMYIGGCAEAQNYRDGKTVKNKETEAAKRLLKVSDIAGQTGFAEKTIRKWCSEKKLPAFIMGGEYRVQQSDLDQFIKSLKGE